MSKVAEWEIRKHMAIELYPMNLKKQQEYMRRKNPIKVYIGEVV